MDGRDRCKCVECMNEEKKIRILYIVEAMGGGVFTYLSELCNELVDKYEIFIAYGIRQETPADIKIYFDARVRFYHVEHFCRELNPVKDVCAIKEIRQIAKKVKPDIIHLHSSKAGAIGRIAFSGKKQKLFYTPHGYSFLMNDCNEYKRLIYKLLESILAKRKCMTICCGEGEYKEAKKITRNASFVNNAINITEIHNLLNQNAEKNNKFTVFTLGRICRQKNPALFNKIAEQLPDVSFIWIGDGDLKDELKMANIEITGWKSRREALQIANQADVFLLTSNWEGMPLSILEAMYMKKICVVSDIPGNREIIDDDQNGYLCRSVPEYVETIRKIKESDCGKVRECAYEAIMNKYNTAIMGKAYSQIYDNGFYE